MEKTKILICDRCNTRVATRKCFICFQDLCNFCRSKTDKYIEGINLKFLLDYCKNCHAVINKLTKENEDEIFSEIKATLTDNLRKRLILEKLKDKNKNEN